jgi:glutamine amidotransferase
VFQRVSGVVASETVVAHVRKATQGALSVLNCHPFQHGRWVFAHNGDVPNFAQRREALVAEVSPRLRRYILGETDSEVLFFLVLTQLLRYGSLSSAFRLDDVVNSVNHALALVRHACDEPEKRASLTCILTDGSSMVGVHGGKELYYSTYKRRCGDRAVCAHLSAACEAPPADGVINHLIFSSQPLSGENVWHALEEGDLVAVDGSMRLYEPSARLLRVV